MQVIIIEDETPAANRLNKLLLNISSEMEVVCRLDSVESSVKYFQPAPAIDLVFMDIQLADGVCFDIFQQVKIKPPVIYNRF